MPINLSDGGEMSKRSYQQNCSLAYALDIIGDRWTLLIIRELIPGPRRYKTLLSNLNGIGTNLLAERLRSLDTHGVIEKVLLDASLGGSQIWQLTKLGKELEPAVVSLAKWGLDFSKFYSVDKYWSPMWNYIALQARYSPTKAVGIHVIGQFKIDDYNFCIRILKEKFNFSEGVFPESHFQMESDGTNFSKFIQGEVDLDDFTTSWVKGNTKKFLQCLKCFI